MEVLQINGQVEIVEDLLDLKENIIECMGYDAWVFMSRGQGKEVAELKSTLDIRNSEIEGYDVDVTSLRSTCCDVLEMLDDLIMDINDAKRLDRNKIIDKLCGMKKVVRSTEGF